MPSLRYQARGRVRDVQSKSESKAENEECLELSKEELYDATSPAPEPEVEDLELSSWIRQLALDEDDIESSVCSRATRRGSSCRCGCAHRKSKEDEDILVVEEEEGAVNSASTATTTTVDRSRTKTKKPKNGGGGKREDETQDWDWRRVDYDTVVVDVHTRQRDHWSNLQHD